MMFEHDQNWRTTAMPHSLALVNTVNTGGSFTTPSGAIANSQRWAAAGFRGYGPTKTFPGGSGLDGLGCGCGCGCDGQCGSTGSTLLWLGIAAAAYFWFSGRWRRSEA